MLSLLGLPVQASTHAGEIDRLIVALHYLMFALFIAWGIYFVYVLFRFRASANPVASYEGAKGKASKVAEVAVAAIEAIILLFYAIPAWATRVSQIPPENEAVVVRVVAEQFAWNIHYPGPDGKFGRSSTSLVSPDNPLGLDRTDPAAKDDITTINQLNLPINRPVIVHLGSKDVIHSFGVYELRVKQDAVPGMEFPVWFIPSRVGEYEIACSQLCGLGHYRMRGFVNVKSEADFKAFLDEEAKNRKS
jgi:cytochrome c oxidase subunit 2